MFQIIWESFYFTFSFLYIVLEPQIPNWKKKPAIFKFCQNIKWFYKIIYSSFTKLTLIWNKAIILERTLRMYVFTQLLCYGQNVAQGQLLSSVAGLNSVFLLDCLTKVKELSLPYYLPIGEKRIEGFMPFPKSISGERKLKKPHPWQGVGSLIPFSMITITLRAPPKMQLPNKALLALLSIT